jgi:hypothetical protein
MKTRAEATWYDQYTWLEEGILGHTIFLVLPPTLPVTRESDSEKVALEAPVKSDD